MFTSDQKVDLNIEKTNVDYMLHHKQGFLFSLIFLIIAVDYHVYVLFCSNVQLSVLQRIVIVEDQVTINKMF